LVAQDRDKLWPIAKHSKTFEFDKMQGKSCIAVEMMAS
jgi:hypothetical protein